MAGASENEGKIFFKQSFSKCVIGDGSAIIFPPGNKILFPRGYSHQSPRSFTPRVQGFSVFAVPTGRVTLHLIRDE